MKIGNRKLVAVAALSMLIGAAIGGTAMARQVRMWNALHDLQAAQAELQGALADKGGHRVAAMNLIAQAITEVNAGLEAGALN
jgi:hypothetical protein